MRPIRSFRDEVELLEKALVGLDFDPLDAAGIAVLLIDSDWFRELVGFAPSADSTLQRVSAQSFLGRLESMTCDPVLLDRIARVRHDKHFPNDWPHQNYCTCGFCRSLGLGGGR